LTTLSPPTRKPEGAVVVAEEVEDVAEVALEVAVEEAMEDGEDHSEAGAGAQAATVIPEEILMASGIMTCTAAEAEPGAAA